MTRRRAPPGGRDVGQPQHSVTSITSSPGQESIAPLARLFRPLPAPNAFPAAAHASHVLIVAAIATLEGEGMEVRRALPSPGLPRLDPFLLLDHLGPWDHGPGEAKGAPDHPHRGFETVTIVLEGELEHKDSQGNEGHLAAGDVQWMTAGAGVVHSEMPSAAIRRDGGRVHGLQLWVNLPAADKMVPPRYQDVRAADIPVVDESGARVRVVAGSYRGASGPARTHTPITYLHVHLGSGADWTQPRPNGEQGFLYCIDGHLRAGDAEVPEAHLLVLPEGDLQVQAIKDSQFLWVAGRPLGEPVVQWGPFVMNDRKQILEAVQDYQSGRMGSIVGSYNETPGTE